MSMQQRMEEVERRIQAACSRSGRSREDVNVIAVTKYVSLETTAEAYRSRLNHLGENRVQDAADKWRALSGGGEEGPIWHFIGSLQTNKVKDVIGKFTYIHSLDRLPLAEEIQKRAARLNLTVPCFIQVNVSGEPSKHGLSPNDLSPFVDALKAFPSICPVGLMTMAPFESDPERTRSVFRALRTLRDGQLERQGAGGSIRHLSMGMSNDFEIAIEEGATWIRLGTILVGKEEE